MQQLLFRLALAVIYPISYLPFPALYLLSDVGYILLYYVIRYRRKVVALNIKRSFPEKYADELKRIEKQYYRNLCDIILENVKFLTISKEAVANRVNFTNRQIIDDLFKENKSAIITLGHCGNWEMAGLAASFMLPHHSVAIYRPLKNKYFDQLIHDMRARFGMELVPQNNTRALLRQIREGGRLYHFITDQTPGRTAANHWTIFLNQETPVFLGTEKVATLSDLPVWHAHIYRKKRGYYDITFHVVSLEPKTLEPGAITELHTRELEENIRKQPDNWLWSHRRWKHTRPEDMELYKPPQRNKLV